MLLEANNAEAIVKDCHGDGRTFCHYSMSEIMSESCEAKYTIVV